MTICDASRDPTRQRALERLQNRLDGNAVREDPDQAKAEAEARWARAAAERDALDVRREADFAKSKVVWAQQDEERRAQRERIIGMLEVELDTKVAGLLRLQVGATVDEVVHMMRHR